MMNSQTLKDLELPEIKASFEALSKATQHRATAGEAPIELMDLFARFPFIEEVRDSLEIYGSLIGVRGSFANLMGNSGIMPLGALAMYDRAHDLGIVDAANAADIPTLLVSFMNRGPQEIPRIVEEYPVVKSLMDLTMIDAIEVGASHTLVALMGQGAVYSLGVMVELAENPTQV